MKGSKNNIRTIYDRVIYLKLTNKFNLWKSDKTKEMKKNLYKNLQQTVL